MYQIIEADLLRLKVHSEVTIANINRKNLISIKGHKILNFKSALSSGNIWIIRSNHKEIPTCHLI
jgi:hypothetical protein